MTLEVGRTEDLKSCHALRRAVFIEEQEEVKVYQANFQHLVALSLSPPASLKMIKSATST